MRRSSRVIALWLAVLGSAVTGCASASGTSSRASQGRVADDARVIGKWRVTTIQVADRRPVHADSTTTASLSFGRDGRLIANEESCSDGPHFVADGAHITVDHWPRSIACFEAGWTSTPIAKRFAQIVDRLTVQPRMAYVMHGGDAMTIWFGHYRVVLRRRLHPHTPGTARQSTPRPYPASPTASPTG